MKTWAQSYPNGVIIHASAVGDYEVSQENALKIPSGRTELHLTLHLRLKLRRSSGLGVHRNTITFKAASPDVNHNLVDIARAQRRRQVDYVFKRAWATRLTDCLLG